MLIWCTTEFCNINDAEEVIVRQNFLTNLDYKYESLIPSNRICYGSVFIKIKREWHLITFLSEGSCVYSNNMAIRVNQWSTWISCSHSCTYKIIYLHNLVRMQVRKILKCKIILRLLRDVNKQYYLKIGTSV